MTTPSFFFRFFTIMSESQENRVYPGITKPLSLEKPGPRDIQLTIELEKTLNLYGLYDSEERAQQR